MPTLLHGPLDRCVTKIELSIHARCVSQPSLEAGLHSCAPVRALRAREKTPCRKLPDAPVAQHILDLLECLSARLRHVHEHPYLHVGDSAIRRAGGLRGAYNCECLRLRLPLQQCSAMMARVRDKGCHADGDCLRQTVAPWQRRAAAIRATLLSPPRLTDARTHATRHTPANEKNAPAKPSAFVSGVNVTTTCGRDGSDQLPR